VRHRGRNGGGDAWKDFSGGPISAYLHQFACDLTKRHFAGKGLTVLEKASSWPISRPMCLPIGLRRVKYLDW